MMPLAQAFRPDLSSPGHLAAYFAGAVVMSALLYVVSAITRTAQAATRLVRGQR